MEIQVGEYVRTKKGIRKIVEIDDDNNYYIDKIYINDFGQKIDCITDSCIIGKSSKNLIDLIEVGDYVNGWKVLYWTDGTKIVDDGYATDLNKMDIKSIVTKEQFESIKYEV